MMALLWTYLPVRLNKAGRKTERKIEWLGWIHINGVMELKGKCDRSFRGFLC